MEKRPPVKTTSELTWKILVIDNDEDDFLIARDMLREAKGRKIVTHWASSYDAGQKALAEGPYDAALVDYDLGARTGIELIRAACEHDCDTPLILFTGRGGYEVDNEAMTAGATLYLTKNEANPLLLERIIRYAIELKHKENSLRKSEAILRQDEAWFRTTLFSIGDAVITCDPQGHITFLNPVAEDLTGWPNQEAAGKPLEIVFNIINEQSGVPAKNPVDKVMQTGSIIGLANHSALINRAGETIAIEDSAAPIKDDSGQIVGVVMVFHDVSERRKAAEQVAYQAELLAQVQDAVFATDEGWKGTYWNRMAEEIFGWSKEETIGKILPELFRSEFPHTTRDLVHKQLMEAGHWEGEVLYHRKDGSTFFAQVRTAQISSPQEKQIGFVSSVRDITELHRTHQKLEQANQVLHDQAEELEVQTEELKQQTDEWISANHLLAASEQKYALLFGKSAVPSALTLLPDATFVDANEAFEKLFGYPRKELLGKTSLEVGIAKPSERAVTVSEVAKKGQHHDAEKCLRTKSGEELIGLVNADRLEMNGKQYTITTIQNITERKRAEQALKESEEKFAKAFQASPAGQLITRRSDGVIIDVNASYERLLGYSRAELIDHKTTELNIYLNPQERERVLNIFVSEGRVYNLEMALRNKAGELVSILGSIEALTIGGEDYLLSTLMDITESKRAGAALRESEARMRDFLENTQESIIILDRDWRLQYINRHGAKTLGVIANEVFGKDFWEVFSRYLGTPVEQQYRKAMEERVAVHFEMGGLYNPQWYDVNLIPTQEGIAVFAADRSAEKNAREELDAAYARLRAHIDANIIGVVRSREDGTILEANDYYLELIGYTRAEIEAGRVDWRALTPPEYTPTDNFAIQELRRQGKTTTHEKEYLRRDGTRVWVQINDAMLADGSFASYVLDITERKCATEAMRKSEEKFERSFHSSPVAIAISTVADGRFIEVNDSYTGLFGFSREELVGHTSLELGMFPDPNARQEIVRHFHAGGGFRDYELRMLAKSGEYRDVLFSTESIEIDSQECMLSILVDFTKLKRAETELQQYADRLKQSNQELEQFAFVASHDLQEPLRKIKMFGSLIQQQLKGHLDGETQDIFQRMLNANERMQAMIDDLLELSRISTKGRSFMIVDLDTVAEEVVSDLEPRILRAGGQVILEKLPSIEADPLQIHQVLQNLISNAIKFNQPGVPPRVKVSGQVIKAPTGKGQLAIIQVQDNGIGFNEEQFEKIMQPFQRLHGRGEYEGTGMGLAIVKKIVERHHGEISAHSAPGKGATFTITLPVKSTMT
jgi:PAS domain S-box-containing protein